ncbi:MAG: cupin domain-containing protein [Paenibacillus macerans]|uniref:Cupin domain protein n=1 Tax=Paenibacillus macerans TaxID=44252 RepID=A0A091A2L7_PAEMA|nr:cupin domain-containing protein [Paenibacillus macerans]KFN10531.1 cupin domain protein [Paenibacillus macerans]MBS5912269.1 cupin domain-containing protein [Paenibacillus macerans]MCY7562776.1 cupin domain-containing protein [Paenibacillus macerans]MDU7476054.1 cupin domain-containing protein [Paenibacillus macerans]MEC0138524.1 cupin domain-containing protein [Paenibacillus macerans]
MISKSNAEHYIWGERCDGWRLVDREEMSVIHEKMPPNTRETRHFHIKASQFFFVLSGYMHIEVDGTEHLLQAHEGIEVRPGTPHQVFNKSEHPLEFLVYSQPNTRNDRVQA